MSSGSSSITLFLLVCPGVVLWEILSFIRNLFYAPSANTLIERCLKSVRLERGRCGRYTFYMKEEKVIQLDPDILGGAPVFSGTRVPIKSLFDHPEGGDSIDDFLEGFPSVRRDQVIALLQISQERVLQPA